MTGPSAAVEEEVGIQTAQQVMVQPVLELLDPVELQKTELIMVACLLGKLKCSKKSSYIRV